MSHRGRALHVRGSQRKGAGSLLPSSDFAAPPTSSTDLEIVWDGPRPRLRRKLKMGMAGPEPDFEAAADRALSTARRLGLSPRSPRMPSSGAQSARLTRPVSRGGRGPDNAAAANGLSTEAPITYVGNGEPGAEAWLADQDFLETLDAKMRDAQAYISQHGPEQARRATAELRGSRVVDGPRLHMQMPSVALEAVLLDKLPSAKPHHPAAQTIAARPSGGFQGTW
jgi:hypothetical protein